MERFDVLARVAALIGMLVASACMPTFEASAPALPAIPAVEEYCLAAQRLVTRTDLPMKLEVQPDFAAFVKSKALIEGPTIQQFDWRDADGKLIGVSCKLKNADHLLATFGAGSAGPDGTCQDFNEAVYRLVAREARRSAYPNVVFDPRETVVNEANPGMTGPDWLAPFTLTSVDADGSLRIHTKGFIVNFSDSRYAQLPERFRGVHYCHFIAPNHLGDLLEGRASPGAVIGKVADTNQNSVGR